MSREEAAKKGGQATAQKHGEEFYEKIGEKGGESRGKSSHDKGNRSKSARVGGDDMSTQGGSRMVESDRGPNRGEAYGAAALTQKLHGISFPVPKEQFQWTKDGETLTLRDCLQNLPEQINSVTQITETVSNSVKQGAGQR